MKRIRLLVIFGIMIALMIPVAVNAAGVFYCSTSLTEGGIGTLTDPWACSTDEQFQEIVDDQICALYSGGYLYQLFPSSYRYHVVTWYSVDDCRITSSTDYAGSPPYTGVDVPTPIIVGGATLVGAGLLAAGIFLRRKRATAQ
jgi:hypothetical protein